MYLRSDTKDYLVTYEVVLHEALYGRRAEEVIRCVASGGRHTKKVIAFLPTSNTQPVVRIITPAHAKILLDFNGQGAVIQT